MSEALNIIKDPTLTYNQELIALAKVGENSDDTIQFSEEYKKAAARVGCRFLDTLPWRIPITSDGVHFSEDGHALFACKMTEHLRHLSCDLL